MTTCCHGHTLDESNSRVNSQGSLICVECKRDNDLRYYYGDHEGSKEKLRLRYIIEAEGRKASRRVYHAKHPEVARRGNATRRSRKLGQFIEEVDPQIVYEMHGGMCGICKGFIDLSETTFHVDHVIPLAKGGLHGYVNVQPAHPTCNLQKGTR